MIGHDFTLRTAPEGLSGGEYVELQTAPFAETWWQPDSIYVPARTFALFDAPLRGRCGYADIYSTIDVDRDTGELCVDAWRTAAREIKRGAVLPVVQRFGIADVPMIDGDIRLQTDSCVALLRGMADFVELHLSTHERVAIVGL